MGEGRKEVGFETESVFLLIYPATQDSKKLDRSHTSLFLHFPCLFLIARPNQASYHFTRLVEFGQDPRTCVSNTVLYYDVRPPALSFEIK